MPDDDPRLDDAAPPAEPDLVAAQDRVVALWSEMGSKWGIPRTMAEVHALLFMNGRSMNADEVMERLGISRGNASMTLRSLVDWGIVKRVHRRGERKEYFQAEQDVWKLFRTIIRERKRREIDPLLPSLRDCKAPSPSESSRRLTPEALAVEAHNERIDDLLQFIETIQSISERFLGPTGKGLRVAATLLNKVS